MMDKEKVREALLLINKALKDDDFLAWVEENEDDLDLGYDNYKTKCYETGEEPEDFYTWALWQYVNAED